jgi:hypothetical protein
MGEVKMNLHDFIDTTMHKNVVDYTSMLLLSCIIMGLGLDLTTNPYMRETIPIAGLTGIFIRTIMLILIMTTIWTWQYGLFKAIGLTVLFYSFINLIFSNVIFAAYGQTVLQSFTPYISSWDIRLVIMFFCVPVIIYFRLYNINWKSMLLGSACVEWLLFMAYTWPIEWINGEGNIPLQPIPQLTEFIEILLFCAWFFTFIKPKKGFKV